MMCTACRCCMPAEAVHDQGVTLIVLVACCADRAGAMPPVQAKNACVVMYTLCKLCVHGAARTCLAMPATVDGWVCCRQEAGLPV